MCPQQKTIEDSTIEKSGLVVEPQETTELVFILDRSGSMHDVVKETINGFNQTIERQARQAGCAFVTTVLFDTVIEELYEHEPLENVEKLTRREYNVRGCTALLDAVGTTIKRINRRQKKSTEGRPGHTVFVITTDGLENASRKFSADEVRKLIKKRQRKNGWDFIFLGANIDAVETADELGIAPSHAANYRSTPMGTEKMYGAIDYALTALRVDGTLSCEWKAGLEADDALS